MLTSVLVVSYNTRELTLACLRSVYEQTKGIEFEVIVVDNASADGSAEAIAAEFGQVKLIRSDRNLGFAGGNNLAAKQATGERLLLLNPDTVVLDAAVDRLVAFAGAHPEAGIFGGRTVFADRTLNPASCWRFPTVWSLLCIGTGLTSMFRKSGLFNPEAYGRWKRDTVRRVDIVSGCFLLIRRKLWDQLGGFDPAFFMYGEEADLCWRAAKAGERCLICPDAQIIHYGGASETVRADATVKLFVAKARLFARHWSRPGRWFGVRMLDLWAWSRMVVMGALIWVRPGRAESYRTWRDVWCRRAEWDSA
jgi:GT2 family glycosyltransferase